MLPAYKKENELWAAVGQRPDWVANALKLGLVIDPTVEQVMRTIDRDIFILPFFEQLNTIDETTAREAAMFTVMGLTAPIGIGDALFINSTALPFDATMITEGLKTPRRQRVLVIGSGCGYVPAVLSKLGFAEIDGVEIREDFADMSAQILASNGYPLVTIHHANAAEWIKQQDAPFDLMISFAAIPSDDEGGKVLQGFLDHLSPQGLLITPHGEPDYCPITVFSKDSGIQGGYVLIPEAEFTPFVI